MTATAAVNQSRESRGREEERWIWELGCGVWLDLMGGREGEGIEWLLARLALHLWCRLSRTGHLDQFVGPRPKWLEMSC